MFTFIYIDIFSMSSPHDSTYCLTKLPIVINFLKIFDEIESKMTFPAPSTFQRAVKGIVIFSSASTMPSCGSILNYICPYLTVTEVTPTTLLQLAQTHPIYLAGLIPEIHNVCT